MFLKRKREKKNFPHSSPATLADHSKFTMSVHRVPKAPVELADPEAVCEDPFDPVTEGQDVQDMLAEFAVASPNGDSNKDESGDGLIPPPGPRQRGLVATQRTSDPSVPASPATSSTKPTSLRTNSSRPKMWTTGTQPRHTTATKR